MTVTILHEVEESLRALDPDTLREMVYQTVRSHINVCQLTSQVGGCAHIDGDETRDSVDALGVAGMAGILAPTAVGRPSPPARSSINLTQPKTKI